MSKKRFRTQEGADNWGTLLNARGFAGVIYFEEGRWVADFPGHQAPDFQTHQPNEGES